ncbi:Rz1-like lysis system protein LysC [Enterobacter pasteurii]
MMLSGCSGTMPKVLPCPQTLIPEYLLAPCELPDYDIQRWGDYPDYTSRLQLSVNKCNSDKEVLNKLLSINNF